MVLVNGHHMTYITYDAGFFYIKVYLSYYNNETSPMVLVDGTVATSSALIAQAPADRPLEEALAT